MHKPVVGEAVEFVTQFGGAFKFQTFGGGKHFDFKVIDQLRKFFFA